MSTWQRRLVGVVVVLGVVGSVLAAYLGGIAPVATGYAAKITCSGSLLAGRSVDAAAADLPDNPLVPLLRTRVAPDEGRATASLLGLWETTAWHTPGLGCTLADEQPSFTAIAPADPVGPRARWPRGDRVDLEAERSRAPIDADELDAAVTGAFVEDDPDGLKQTRAVVVVRGNRIIAEQYAPGFDADTPLLGWSMGKSIANMIVGRLVMSGDLRLRGGDLLPQWSDDLRADITVEQLLQMTSGLAFEESYDPDTDATNMLFRPGSTAEFAAAMPLEANPGTWWSYSSGSTNILCDVAAQAGGFGPEMARALVFDPLGMDSAVLEPDASSGLVCSSFPYATARDWARFGLLYLRDGVWLDDRRLLSRDWIDFTTTPVDLRTRQPYGAHWWLNAGADGDLRMPSVPADAFWASGNEGQQVVVIPSANLVVVRLGFTSDFSGIDWGLEELLDGVLGSLPNDGGRSGSASGGSGSSGQVVNPDDDS